MPKLTAILCFFASLFGCCRGSLAQVNESSTISFLFYNVENLFDCENDSLTNDDEFTPDGDRRWTTSRLRAKIDRIAKVIVSAGKWNAPVCIGLCEIENRAMLEMLIHHESLEKFGYKIIHKDSPDERGIDVAFLYRPQVFKPYDFEAIPVIVDGDASFRTREILQVSGLLNGCDTLHFWVNHWPSRYGGVAETAQHRIIAAKALRAAIQRIQRLNQTAKVVCMGDFNDQPDDRSISTELLAASGKANSNGSDLINLSNEWLRQDVKTLKNKYSWELFDQWIVTRSFLESGRCYQYVRSAIFAESYLLENDTQFGGLKPKRTYVGYKYQEGFSDHLPIVLQLRVKGN